MLGLSAVRTLRFTAVAGKAVAGMVIQRTAATKASTAFAALDTFERRHNGTVNQVDIDEMLKTVGVKSLEEMVKKTVPNSILETNELDLPPALSETEVLARLKDLLSENEVWRSYIGMGYAGTNVPHVILRNLLENPGWYTQYTPYQPEMSQGRLESLLNYQTMVCDLTGLPKANSSLLDEATAAAEAAALAFSTTGKKKDTIYIDENMHPTSIKLVETRAAPMGLKVVVGDLFNMDIKGDTACAVMVGYPDTHGTIKDLKKLSDTIHSAGGLMLVASDLLALTVLRPPSEFDADICFGNSQRFGVPLGFGGPHAAFFAVQDKYLRKVPGRIVGVSRDADGNTAYRLALQAREQHIRREKATSNICTAQALLANMAANYAVYHGPQGLTDIANRVHRLAVVFAEGAKSMGHTVTDDGPYFDTVRVKPTDMTMLKSRAEQHRINLRYFEDGETVGITMDETVSAKDLEDLFDVFNISEKSEVTVDAVLEKLGEDAYEFGEFTREGKILDYPVFHSHQSETQMLRYLKYLENRDVSLAHTMIPLGSCTMKLNATTEMLPVSWPEVNAIHPYAPLDQSRGYRHMFKELEHWLCEITGYDRVSLQPNSGAQGEYAGLMAIRAYLADKGEGHRKVCLVPASAHGTNPASAQMAGMDVVAVKNAPNGEIDLTDLKAKCEKHSKELAAIMVTYPSTYGVFDDNIKDVCDLVHEHGGQVYLDGANMNAQVAICCPGKFGADVSHLNLHKTFCIPHGGGGPGMGPIGVRAHLAPYLPNHPIVDMGPHGGDKAMGTISGTPFGSASILPISWAYIRMMGSKGLRNASELAILNANYMARRLDGHYKILYKNSNGFCAHEFIMDCRPFGESAGVEGADIAKRLQDYGFHSPTMSWPVPNTLMVEPTESEAKDELDRYCDALIAIREEIREIEEGKYPRDNNVLKNAPHTIQTISAEDWDRPYTREKAVFPVPWLRRQKFFPVVTRIDDVFGDRNVVCSCPPMEAYM
eukprot:Clim_evm12s247 gene=Clim_evmTU12s247